MRVILTEISVEKSQRTTSTAVRFAIVLIGETFVPALVFWGTECTWSKYTPRFNQLFFRVRTLPNSTWGRIRHIPQTFSLSSIKRPATVARCKCETSKFFHEASFFLYYCRIVSKSSSFNFFEWVNENVYYRKNLAEKYTSLTSVAEQSLTSTL